MPKQVVVELGPTTSLNKINNRYNTTSIEHLDNTNIYLLQLSAGSSVSETVRQMEKDTRLLLAEPNFMMRPLEGDLLDGEARHRAWGISDAAPSLQDDAASALNLSMAQNLSQGSGSTVAVLDTGVQLDHPALQPNLAGIKGYDFVDNDDNPSDSPVGEDFDNNGVDDEMVGHGTHVAGIVARVAPKAKIMPLRVLNTDGYGDAFTIAKAIIFAKRNGANVINLSLGTTSYSKLLRKVIQDAITKDTIKRDRTSTGVLVVAAAGNSNTSQRYYPAAGDRDSLASSADGLVAVTSVNKDGQKSSFANYGSWVDIAAPGEGIYSTFPVSLYAYWSGTSMATPFVSGEAALIHAYAPYGKLKPAALEERMRCSARSLDETNPTFVGMLGAGETDAGASLTPDGACPETIITAGPSGLTNSASAAFVFSSLESGSSFECMLDSEAYASCSSPKSYSGLTDGEHTFYVKATDATGDTDPSPAQQSFTVDATGPNTTIESGPQGPTNDDTPSYGWSGSDNLTTGGNLLYSWRLDNGEWSTYSSGTSITLGGINGLADGSYTLQVRARDQAGNVDLSPAERSFTVDTAVPDAPEISNPANGSYDNDRDITVSGTAEVGSTVELFEGSNSRGKAIANANGEWSVTLPGVAEGSHTYTAKATDTAGNTSADSNACTVIVDTTAPTVNTVAPADGATAAAPTGNIEATFDEAMDPTTLNQNTFTLVEQGSTTPLEATVTYDVATKKATLTPAIDLQANTTYIATVYTDAKDAAGNPLATDKVWSFTTAAPVS